MLEANQNTQNSGATESTLRFRRQSMIPQMPQKNMPTPIHPW